jgi:hypothetical protein
MTQARPANNGFSMQWITNAAWAAVDVVTLFARSLIDPSVRTLADTGAGGANGTGVRRVATLHHAPVRGSGAAAGGGNRVGGSGPSGSGSGSAPSNVPRPGPKIAGYGPTKCGPTGG